MRGFLLTGERSWMHTRGLGGELGSGRFTRNAASFPTSPWLKTCFSEEKPRQEFQGSSTGAKLRKRLAQFLRKSKSTYLLPKESTSSRSPSSSSSKSPRGSPGFPSPHPG